MIVSWWKFQATPTYLMSNNEAFFCWHSTVSEYFLPPPSKELRHPQTKFPYLSQYGRAESAPTNGKLRVRKKPSDPNLGPRVGRVKSQTGAARHFMFTVLISQDSDQVARDQNQANRTWRLPHDGCYQTSTCIPIVSPNYDFLLPKKKYI